MQIILKELQESAAAVETAGPPVTSPKAATVPATFAKNGDKHDVVRTKLQINLCYRNLQSYCMLDERNSPAVSVILFRSERHSRRALVRAILLRQPYEFEVLS